jgi:hypothetical protein
MKSISVLFSALASTVLAAEPASAAVVAVMPVQAANLPPGQCDAIGVLFTQAFARETNVAVASPLETGPLLAQGRTGSAVAAQLGAAEFVDLRLEQAGNQLTLAGIRYGKDGNEIFRSETAAASLDDMQAATARLARSLAWRQPVAYAPYSAPGPMMGPALVLGPPSAEAAKSYPKALGLKLGFIFPWSRSNSYSPMMSLQFDARFGSRDAFIEIGAGAALPTGSSSLQESSRLRMGGVFAEIGGSVYLSDGGVAPYLGGGVSPRIWILDTPNGSSTDGTTCAVYGQAGLTLTRDSRARLYAELRVSQYVIGLAHGGYSSTDAVYPTEFALQMGLGW